VAVGATRMRNSLGADSVSEPQKMTDGSLPPWSPLLCTLKPRFKFVPRSRQDQLVPFDAEFLHQLAVYLLAAAKYHRLTRLTF
jgi:hypothetical protein